MIARPCITCGAVIKTGTRCDDCSKANERQRDRTGRTHSPKSSPKSRGYDERWRRLSKRARQLQPFCTDCGSKHDLQADHLPSAWKRKDAGLAVRLQDIEVVCAVCNRKRGAARGENVSHAHSGDEKRSPVLTDQHDEKSRQTATQSRGGGSQQVTTPTPPRIEVSIRSNREPLSLRNRNGGADE